MGKPHAPLHRGEREGPFGNVHIFGAVIRLRRIHTRHLVPPAGRRPWMRKSCA
ncbi:hypothetical protein Pd630_LPD04148 [Rhodococcus opacus PD630]|nr:hypothetical protein Pd630_LPD04148 [Rhodococcus opacus PD630]